MRHLCQSCPVRRDRVWWWRPSRRANTVQIIGHCAPEGGELATDDTRVGVVSFATSGDAELGEYDEELTIIFKAGRLPAPIEVG